jgi:putative membrane protein
VKQSLANRFLTAAERERVTRCVREVEKSTSGEIVPLVRSASYHYPAAVLLGSLVVSMLLAAGATAADAVFKPWGSLRLVDLWVFPAVFVVAYLVVYQLLRGIPALKRPFIAAAEMSEEVGEAALTAFYRHRLAETRDRTGILLFVSVYERRAVVLADKGINLKVPPETWQQVVDLVVEAIRDGRPAEGLCEAVARCGQIVSSQFPVRAGDKDELRNLIVED